jgi:hypothetical protein
VKGTEEIRTMITEAFVRQGWPVERDPETDTVRPVHPMARTPVDTENERTARHVAEGVEAGLLWALGDAGSPFASLPPVNVPYAPHADAVYRTILADLISDAGRAGDARKGDPWRMLAEIVDAYGAAFDKDGA